MTGAIVKNEMSIDKVSNHDRPMVCPTVQAGPFRGYEAIFDRRLSAEDRVRVLFKLLNRRQVALEIPSGQIQRKNR
jgi:hypothetical protein